jgi:hypothetical protein
MGTRRQRARNPSFTWDSDLDSPIDWKMVRTGLIPWTYNELRLAVAHMVRLKRAAGTLEGFWSQDAGTGRIERRFTGVENADGLDGPLSLFVLHRCEGLGCDRTATASHIWRFTEIRCFVAQQFRHLIGIGLASVSREGREFLSEGLLRALAEATYEGIRTHPVSGSAERTFHYTALVHRATGLGRSSHGARDP